MPIEIRELHIRVAVSTPAGEAGTPAQPAPSQEEAGREALVVECVEQVLRILQNRSER